MRAGRSSNGCERFGHNGSEQADALEYVKKLGIDRIKIIIICIFTLFESEEFEKIM